MGLFFSVMKVLLTFLSVMATVAIASAQQWTRISVPTTASFRGLSVVNDKVIWASGTEGTVIRTIDGGKKWSVMHVAEPDKLDFRGIHAFSAKTAVIISSGPAEKRQAHIYRTSNGGKVWSQVFEDKTLGVFFDAVAFWDSKHGIVLSDPVDGHFVLFTTNDGGFTWKQTQPKSLPPALPNEGAFAASNSCLTVQGTNDVWFATGGAAVARLFHSPDRGQTWTVAETPIHPANASSGIFSLHFTDAQNGLAAGGDYQHPESSELPNLMRTTDGGQTWQPAPTDPAGVYFSSVIVEHTAAGEGRIIAAGIKGIWINSAAGWQHESSENVNTVAAGPGTVWAVGPKGLVLRR